MVRRSGRARGLVAGAHGRTALRHASSHRRLARQHPRVHDVVGRCGGHGIGGRRHQPDPPWCRVGPRRRAHRVPDRRERVESDRSARRTRPRRRRRTRARHRLGRVSRLDTGAPRGSPPHGFRVSGRAGRHLVAALHLGNQWRPESRDHQSSATELRVGIDAHDPVARRRRRHLHLHATLPLQCPLHRVGTEPGRRCDDRVTTQVLRE